MGDDFSFYQESRLGGPFLNYHLTKYYLMEEKSLHQKAELYQKLIQHQADIILDQEGVYKNLLKDLPLLKELYVESKPGFYVKR
jgi:hypothetical protein